MATKGKTQLLITWVASPDKVAEMDRLVESHGPWMAKTHQREGSNALLSYTSPRVLRWRTRSTPAGRDGGSGSAGGNKRHAARKTRAFNRLRLAAPPPRRRPPPAAHRRHSPESPASKW